MIKTLYLIHHSHTDLGYTHPQPAVRYLHARYIEEVLSEIERTRNYPAGARMKWTCETLFPVFDWLKTSTAAAREHFCQLEREGFIEVTGCWEILTQSSPPRAWDWMMERVKQARETHGWTIRSAMLSDINGAPWALPDRLSGNGILHFSMSINEHFGKSIFPRLTPFRWRGPQGGVVNVFNGFHYNNNQYFGIPYDMDRALRGVKALQDHLDRDPHFGLDFAFFQVTRPDFNDNGAPDPRLPDFVKAWNEAGHSPRMEIVTLSGFFDAIQESAFRDAPEHTGEWTDFWNFGAASTPYETGLTRRAYRLIEEVETLAHQGATTPALSRIIDSALENAVFHDEHTWGADISVSAPESDTARAGLHYKNDFAYRAHDLALLARGEALVALVRETQASKPGQHLLIANPCQTGGPAAIDVPVEWLLSDVCPTATHIHRMQHTPVNWPATTVEMPTCELPEKFQGFSHARLSLHLQPREVRTLSAGEVFALASPSKTSSLELQREKAILENKFFRVRLDPITGAIASIRDKATDWELLPSHQKSSGVPVSESPEGGDRTEIHPIPDWTKFMGYKGFQTSWKAVRQQALPTPSCMLTRSDWRASLRQTFNSPHAAAIAVTITLDDAIEAIAVEVTIDFRRTARPLSWYWPLHFALGAPSFEYDNCGTPIRLGYEQLPGANMDYQSVHRWIRISDESRSVLVFPLDTPIACLGGFTFGRLTDGNTRREPMVAAMLQSNYWDTNYAAFCDGSINFRFFVSPGHYATTLEAADALSDRLAHTPLVVPFARSLCVC